MDLKETSWEGMDWSHLTKERDIWRAMVMNLVFPQNLQNISSSYRAISFSRNAVLDGVRLFVSTSSCGFDRIAESHTGLYNKASLSEVSINPLNHSGYLVYHQV